jgi:putative transposase
MQNPFRYFNSSPEVIRLVVMMYIRYPLSLRQVEDLLHERGIDICHETVRFWWNRFGPMFAAGIRKRRIHHRLYSQWRWHLDGRCHTNFVTGGKLRSNVTGCRKSPILAIVSRVP